jgi:hypothetical protein
VLLRWIAKSTALTTAVVCSAAWAAADTITLKNGRVIEAEHVWREGSQVRYHKDGGVFGIPQEIVSAIGSAAAPAAANAGVPAPSRPPTIHETQFRIRYEGSINEPLGSAVLGVLSQAAGEFQRRLGIVPEQPITVLLQSGAEFKDDARTPIWAAGVNDGIIRVPVRGVQRLEIAHSKILRHELAHTFVTAGTGGNCPTWLQEGVAQWLEGGDPQRGDAVVAAAIVQKRFLPLISLEGPFQQLDQQEVTIAYAESLSIVAHIIRAHGEAGLVRFIAALGDRIPADEALQVALAKTYPEIQSHWEQYIVGKHAQAANGRAPAANNR